MGGDRDRRTGQSLRPQALRLDDVDLQSLEQGWVDRVSGRRGLEIGQERVDLRPVTLGDGTSRLLPEPHADERNEHRGPSRQTADRHLLGDRLTELERTIRPADPLECQRQGEERLDQVRVLVEEPEARADGPVRLAEGIVAGGEAEIDHPGVGGITHHQRAELEPQSERFDPPVLVHRDDRVGIERRHAVSPHQLAGPGDCLLKLLEKLQIGE